MVSAPLDTSSKKNVDCQLFFGFGKKIPKDVKRHCGMCRQHGIVVETRGHVCQFKNCDCWKCKLVRQRRSIMSTQIRLRREQDKKFQRTTDVAVADIVPWRKEEEKLEKEEINMCYFCQKCKNHGVLMWKKDHKKNCEYSNCRCEQCDLIDTRRALDRHIKSNRMKSGSEAGSSYTSSSSSSVSPVSIPPPTLQAVVPNTDNITAFTLDRHPAFCLDEPSSIPANLPLIPSPLSFFPPSFFSASLPTSLLPLPFCTQPSLPQYNPFFTNGLSNLHPLSIQIMLAAMQQLS